MNGKVKKSTPSGDVPIQFRPGPLLADLLDRLADQWGVSRNEVSKRLAALAACPLDCRHADLVQKFAGTLPGEPCFVTACERLLGELRVVERMRKSANQGELDENGLQQELQQIVQAYVQQRQYCCDTEEPERAPRLREVRR